MATKGKLVVSARDALAAVRQAVEELTTQRSTWEKSRQALEGELGELLNKPLSKGALQTFLERVTDMNARTFEARFRRDILPGLVEVQRYGTVGRTPLVLADLPRVIPGFGGPEIRTAEAGRYESISSIPPAFGWPGVSADSLCYFLGDAIKARLPELLEQVTLPYPDDGTSLEANETEARAILAKIEEVMAKIEAIDGELAELRHAAAFDGAEPVHEEAETQADAPQGAAQ